MSRGRKRRSPRPPEIPSSGPVEEPEAEMEETKPIPFPEPADPPRADAPPLTWEEVAPFLASTVSTLAAWRQTVSGTVRSGRPMDPKMHQRLRDLDQELVRCYRSVLSFLVAVAPSSGES